MHQIKNTIFSTHISLQLQGDEKMYFAGFIRWSQTPSFIIDIFTSLTFQFQKNVNAKLEIFKYDTFLPMLCTWNALQKRHICLNMKFRGISSPQRITTDNPPIFAKHRTDNHNSMKFVKPKLYHILVRFRHCTDCNLQPFSLNDIYTS